MDWNHFQEPSIEGAPGIWSLEDALAYRAQGKWPTIPATVPAWVKRGPDNTLPDMQIDWTIGKGWIDGKPYSTLDAVRRVGNGSYSRASDAWGYGPDKALKKFGPNVPRLVYDPVTGAALGYRAEGAATNLITQSGGRDGTIGVVGSGGALPTGWGAVAALGLTVEVLATNIDPVIGGCRVRISGTPTSSGVFRMQCSNAVGRQATDPGVVASCFVRGIAGAGNGLINLVNASSGSTPSFNLFDGMPTLAAARRLGVGAGTTASALTVRQEFRFTASSGVPVDMTIEIGGAQIEVGSFPTSYIETTTAAAQRLADSLSFARAGTPEGTVVIRGRTAAGIGGGSVSQTLFHWGLGTTSNANRIVVVRNTAKNIVAVVTVGAVEAARITSPFTVGDNTDLAAALSFKSGQIALAVDGNAPQVITSYAGPMPDLSDFMVGTTWNKAEWYGTIASMRILPKAYDPAQLPGMLS
ncbi:phage head spike fiber domain-containing protein [Aquamicrobium soli]|uniref:Minor tail protein n=1 Tax=Aquamicrobium soli TaxID=1811518 RepID=A0ABV7K996_9HYPH